MKRILLILVALCAIAPAFADDLPSLPNPPMSDGVQQEDVIAFIKQYIMKDKAWKNSLHDFSTSVSMDESKSKVIAGKYREEYMIAQKHWDELYVKRDFAQHIVYGNPAVLLASSDWQFKGKEGMTIDAEGVNKPMGTSQFHSTTSRPILKGRRRARENGPSMRVWR